MDTKDKIFDCRLCGDCCKGFGGTYVTEDDIAKIASFIGENPETFIKKYCVYSGSKPVLALGKDGFCIFFDKEKQCTIHPVKPYMCKAWPYIKTIIKNPENWNAMANSCPGMEKDIPHQRLKQIVRKKADKLDKSRDLA